MRSLLSPTLVLGMLLLVPSEIFAQSASNLELNLFFGGSWYTKNDFEVGFPQSTTPIQGKFRFDRAVRGGVRFNVFTSDHWGEEFFYSYEPNKATFIRRTAPGSTLRLDSQVHQFGINALYYFDGDRTRRVRPFASVGLGATLYRPNGEAKAIARDPLRGNLPGFNEATSVALNYGFGIKNQMGRRVGVRVDVRGFLTRQPSFGIPRKSSNPNTTVFPAGGALNNLEVTGGLVFYFGR